MEWYIALWQWFWKTLSMLIGLILFTSGAIYYLDRGHLIVGDAILIVGLWSCIKIPLGILWIIGMIAFIISTEKEYQE